jgi:hypothetical protein
MDLPDQLITICKDYILMQTILKGFVQKSGETRFSIAVTVKYKSKIETIGTIQYGENDKIDKMGEMVKPKYGNNLFM